MRRFGTCMRWPPPDRIASEAEKQRILQKLLSISRGSRTEAIRYLDHDSPSRCCSDRRALFEHLVLSTLGRRSFNALRKTFHARLLNLITSKSFTILLGPTIFRLEGTPGIFLSLAATQCIDWAAEDINIVSWSRWQVGR
jgi:hypothetical protein